LSPERGGTKTDEVPFVTDQNTFGFGVRVIVNGQWGFAASTLVTPEEIARITPEAVAVASRSGSPTGHRNRGSSRKARA
jgi:TldD protein